jgi:Flp pilus assembly protein CpaB
VTVAARPLEAGEPITPQLAATGLAVRRVPARFVPSGALLDPSQALGLSPQADLPAGGYLLAAQLRSPRPVGPAGRLSPRRTPVQISVTGTGPLLAAGRSPGERVDVVVVSEPRGPGPGRAHVAAAGVPLLAIDGAGRAGTATLGLTRDQALRLIPAQSFARQVTLLPVSGRR